jgi:phosphatidylinositol alpha-mannosyltransferase
MSSYTRQSLKIGIVFDDSLDSHDGVAQQVKTFGGWLSDQGHEVRYLVGETKITTWAGGRVYSLAKNKRVAFNANRLSIPLPADKGAASEVLATEQFDVLHVQVPYSPFLAQKLITLAAPSVAIIGTFHIMPAGAAARMGSRLLKLWYGKSLARFDRFLSVSPPAAEFAEQAFGIKSSILPNVVDVKEISQSTERQQNRPQHIVFLGRLVERKGCEELIAAFALLKRQHPKATLTIGGDGPRRAAAQKLAQKLAIADSVNFLGFIPEKDKAALLASAEIACFPSLHGESFGVVLLEAMAAGAGVVLGGNNPGYASLLSEQPKLLVDPKDTQQLAEAMSRFLDDEKERVRLHKWQQQLVRRYDVGEVGSELLNIYRTEIAKAKKRGHN